MFDLGIQELIVILVIALLVFGPKRLPELGRAIGKTVGQFRNVISDVRNEVEREVHMAENEIDIKELPAWKKKGEGAEPNTAVKDSDEKREDGTVSGADKPNA